MSRNNIIEESYFNTVIHIKIIIILLFLNKPLSSSLEETVLKKNENYIRNIYKLIKWINLFSFG